MQEAQCGVQIYTTHLVLESQVETLKLIQNQ